ncbi:MAG: hypothetical protein AB7S26_24020 [Sandaracinaceae bacterium]
MDRRWWLTGGLGALAVLALTMGSSDPARSKSGGVKIAPEPHERVLGAIWDVMTPTPWNPVDLMGAGGAPERRLGVPELPGFDELTGNLTIGPIGPMIYNSLDEVAFDNTETDGFNEQGYSEHDRKIRFWDREHFGERWTLGVFNRILVRQRVHRDDAEAAIMMYLSDRSRVPYLPAGGGRWRSPTFNGSVMESSDFPSAETTVTDRDGTRYTFTRCPDDRYTDYQFLTRVTDRFGNAVRIARNMFNGDCVPDVISEMDPSGNVERATTFRYDLDEDGGRARTLTEITINAGDADEERYELVYGGLRLLPRLEGIISGPAGDLAHQEMFCFHYHVRTSFLQTGHTLRVVEGPVPRAVRQDCDEARIMGNYALYAFDRNGRLRDVQHADRLGYHVLYNTAREVELFQTWPFDPDDHQDCCQLPRRPDPMTGELVCPDGAADYHNPFCPRHELNYATLTIEGEGLEAEVRRREDNYGRWEEFDRDARGNVRARRTSDGMRWTFTYDDAHVVGRDRPVMTEDPFGRRTRRRYDDWGNIVYEEPGDGTTIVTEIELTPGPFFGTPRRRTVTGLSSWLGDGIDRPTVDVYEWETTSAAGGLSVSERLNGAEMNRVVMSPSGRATGRTDRFGVTQFVSWNGSRATLFYRDETNGVSGSLGSVELSESGERVVAVTNSYGERTAVRRDAQQRVEAVEGPNETLSIQRDELGRTTRIERAIAGADADQSQVREREYSCTGESGGAGAGVGAPGSGADSEFSYEPPYECAGAPSSGGTCDVDPVAAACHTMSSLFRRYRFCWERRDDVAARDGICGCEVSADGDGLGNYTAPDPRFRTCLDEGFYL